MATKTSLKKWIFILSVSIAITPTIYFVKCKIFLTFQCLSWALQLTLFTINYNEFLFRGLEKEKLSSWSGVLYCWACLELFVSMLFEENNWPSLCLLIFYSHLNEYYFLSRICNLIILCSEQCAILVQIYILSVFKWDWMTRNDNFS